METMILEQHWYSSAPVGVKLLRGFQTVAQSEGLGEDQLVEQHCVYRRPRNQKAGTLPVNWGWFYLDAKRVCIHRIGYSGTDEVGRSGNFMAHNLVVRTQDLESIGYDVPSLIRWVRERSKQRYVLPEGEEDGFVRNHNQLYSTFGRDRNVLKALPPLEVPLAEILQVRAKVDDNWESEILQPLSQRLRPDILTLLLSGCFCDTTQRRPILVISPGGDEESWLEFKIAELLFSLVPSYCRAQLTFSTYDDDPLPEPGKTSSTASTHKNRDLMMTTDFESLSRTRGSLANSWFVNCKTGQANVPAPSKLATSLDDHLRLGKHREMVHVRKLAEMVRFDRSWTRFDETWNSTIK